MQVYEQVTQLLPSKIYMVYAGLGLGVLSFLTLALQDRPTTSPALFFLATLGVYATNATWITAMQTIVNEQGPLHHGALLTAIGSGTVLVGYATETLSWRQYYCLALAALGLSAAAACRLAGFVRACEAG